MKIALVHDYLKEYGGAERVLETLHEIWPEAPIFTLVYLPKFLGPHQQRIKDWDVRPIIPSWVPFLGKMISPLRLVAPILFGRLDLSQFDLVIISATGAYNPNLVKTKPGAHVCYCHTPPRYLYGLPTARNWKKHWWIRIPAEVANHFLRMIDYKSAQKVDYFLANSKNTAERIKKFYRRQAKVIYPPVDTSEVFSPFTSEVKKGGYFLAGGRLARPKRFDLAVQACNKLGLNLKIFGRAFAGYGEELKRISGPTVELLGEVSEKERSSLYANCQAFIFTAEEEDFGIVPVEAMAFGKPVIALRQGGAMETIVEGKTGEFFPPSHKASAGHGNEPTVESLVAVLKKFDPKKYRPEDCRKQAEKFSKDRFVKEIKSFIKTALQA